MSLLNSLTTEDAYNLSKSLGLDQPAPKPELGAVGRLGAATLNFIPNVSNALGNTAANLFASPQDYTEGAVPKVIDTQNYAPPSGIAQHAVNYLGEEFIPGTAAFIAAHATGEGFLSDLGLGARAASAIAGAGAGALTAGTPENIPQSTLGGGALTALHGLQPLAKAATVSGAMALNTAYNIAVNNQTLTQAATDPSTLQLLGFGYGPELAERTLNKIAGRGFTVANPDVATLQTRTDQPTQIPDITNFRPYSEQDYFGKQTPPEPILPAGDAPITSILQNHPPANLTLTNTALAFPDEYLAPPIFSNTNEAVDYGRNLTNPNKIDQLNILAELHRNAANKIFTKGDDITDEDLNLIQHHGTQAQFNREAMEAATGTGSAGEYLSKNDATYQPPFPQTVSEGGIAEQPQLQEQQQIKINPNADANTHLQQVINGEKSLVLSNKSDFDSDLIKEAEQEGLRVDNTENGLLIYKNENLDKANELKNLMEFVKNKTLAGIDLDAYQRRMGQLLGYSDKDINDFIDKGQSKRLSYQQKSKTGGQIAKDIESGNFATLQKEQPIQMRKPSGNSNISGSIPAPVLFATARLGTGALVGGSTAYKESEGDWGATLGGALIGAALFEGAGRVAGGLLNTVPREARQTAGENPVKATVKSESDALKNMANSPLYDLAGKAIDGRGTSAQKLARMVEVLTNFSTPKDWHTAMSMAKGAVNLIADQASNAFKDARNYLSGLKPDTLERVGKYFKGQLSPEADVKQLISSEGGMNHDQWLAEKDKDKKVGLDTYWHLKDPVGNKEVDNANFMHVSSETRGKLAQMENDNLIKGLTGSDLLFAKNMQIARYAMNTLQQMVYRALPDSRIADVISGSYDQYLTRRYAFFSDNKQPTDAQVEAAAKQYGMRSGFAILQKAQKEGLAMSPEEYADALQKQPQGLGGALKKESQELGTWQPIEHERLLVDKEGLTDAEKQQLMGAAAGDATVREKWMVHPDVLSKDYANAMDIDFNRKHIEQYLSTLMENRHNLGLNSKANVLDSTILKERESLTPTFRELLGEYKDPVEKITHALTSIIPSARSAEMINGLKDLPTKSGLPAMFDSKESWIKAKTKLQDDMQNAVRMNNTTEVARLQSQLNQLLSYHESGSNLKLGLLKDGMISRELGDVVNGLSGNLGAFDNWAARSWTNKINTYSKIIHSPLNPAMHLRWLFQTPLFMSVARVGPTRAVEGMRDFESYIRTGKMSDNLKEAINIGAIDGTYIPHEIGFSAEKEISGEGDSNIWKKGFHKIFDYYNISDAATRMASYFSAKDRLAAKYGLGLNDSRVVREAVDHMNRYTLNYSDVAPAVRLLRNIPLFNLYASYTWNIARIAKNLMVDAIHPDTQMDQRLHSIGALATIGAGAEILQSASVSALSPQQQKEWQQTQNMLPDYSRSRYRFVMGKDSKGNFNYIDYTSLVPHNDWGQTIRSIANGDMKGLWATNPVMGWDETPAMNIIAQQIAGKDFHNDREFRGFQDRVIATTKDLTPAWTPGIGYDAEGYRNIGITNQKTGRTSTFEGQLLKTFTGLNDTTINSSIVNRTALSEVQDKIQLEREYLNDVLKTNMSQERKDRQIHLYQQAIQTIFQTYRNKVISQ